MKHVSLSVVAAVALSLSSTASADLIQVDLTGTVNFETFASGVLNEAVFISFLYDTDTAPTGGDGTTVSFYPAATLLNFTIGAESWSATGGTQIVSNDSLPANDLFASQWNIGPPQLGGFDPTGLDVTFLGPGDILSSTALPDLTVVQFPNISNFFFFNNDIGVRIEFAFDTVSATIVPLPPAVWAGLAGLVLVVGLRRLGWLF